MAVLLALAGSSDAGPIRGRHPRAGVRTERSLGPAWSHFLEGGPAAWSSTRPPRFPSGLVLERQNGRIAETPFVDYLIWRRNLAPARFDHYHPFVGPALAGFVPTITSLPSLPPPTPRVRAQEVEGPPTAVPHPQVISTPEPGASWLLLAAIAATGVRRRLRRCLG